MKIEKTENPIADFILSDDTFEFGVKELSLLTGELYVWCVVKGKIKNSMWRELYRLRKAAAGRKVTANVACDNRKALAFARFFGFSLVTTVGNTAIMELN